MSPYYHSILHSHKFGGKPEDYNEINFFIDSSKLHFPFWMHRAITHNSFFVGVCERIFGTHIVNSDNKIIPVRVICEEHIKEDCNGKIPTIQEWLNAIANKSTFDWMNNPNKKDKILLNNILNNEK